jgi:hypothetical protein
MITKETFFTPEFKVDALDRIANWESRKHEKPAWTGVFWPGTLPAEHPRNTFHHDGRVTITFDATLRRQDFEAAISRFSGTKTAIESFQEALSKAGLTFAEDDLSFLERSVGGQVNRYEFHKHMLELTSEPKDTTVSRIAFVAERLKLATQALMKGFLFKLKNDGRPKFFEVCCTDDSSYIFNPLNPVNESDIAFRRPFRDENRFNEYWEQREKAHAPGMVNIFNGQDFAEFISGVVLRASRVTGGHSKLAVILTDMAAQGVKHAQLIDHKGQSFTIADLDQLTTLKKARARIHEVCGWTLFSTIRELPSPQIVNRFVVVNRQVIAETPLFHADMEGVTSELSYICENGKTSTSTRGVPKQTLSGTVLEWVGKVVAALHPDQTCVLIDVGLSSTGPNLVAIHDIMEEDWFAVDKNLIINKLAAHQEKLFDHRGFRRRTNVPGVLTALNTLDQVDLQREM